jgi:uncharacterized membrane protein SpoIIM required for sporulation
MTALEFENSNSATWLELEKLLKREDRNLDAARFGELYRTCCEHLALAESRGFPSHVVERLAIVTARAHQIVYRRNEFGLRRIGHALYFTFPSQVRADWPYMLAAALLFLVPTLGMGIATYVNPDLILSLVDEQTVASFEDMYGPAAQSIGRIRDAGTDVGMFGFYIMHNVGIAFQCFATGVLFGLGSLFFLVFNGLYGGAIAGYIASRGLGGNFFPFIATHSAFELTAIVLSGGAGLRIGRSVLLPGRRTRTAALERSARETSSTIFGAAVMLLIAAALEAFWSSAVWVSPAVKYSCAGLCWFAVLLFFLRRPRAS